MSSFSQSIKELRKDNQLTQEEFAKKFNITTRQLQRYESGEQLPSITKLIEIADYFDLSIDYLLGRDTTN